MGITNMGQSLHSVDKHSKFSPYSYLLDCQNLAGDIKKIISIMMFLEFSALVQVGNAPRSASL